MKNKFLKMSVSVLLTLLIMSCPLSVFAVTDNIERVQNDSESVDIENADNEYVDQIAPINEEYLEYIDNPTKYYGAVPSMLDLSYLDEDYADSSAADVDVLPESYDLRDYGRVPAVRDQGNYGTCWAFSATSSAVSGLLNQFPSISFSSAHLSWFTYMGNIESEMYSCYLSNDKSVFNIGGNNYFSGGCMAAWKGPVFSEKLPYSYITKYNEDFSSFENMRYDADYHMQDAFYLPNPSGNSEDDASRDVIKNALRDYGCLTISYNSSDEYYNNETNSQYCPIESVSDHAVLIVGWDDNYPKENFNDGERPENDGAWLIQNSWGTGYNDGGYFWISYEDKTIQAITLFQLEAADNYTKNYQYDITGWQLSLAADKFYSPEQSSREGYAANVFTVESDEQLEAVSFYTTDVDTQYQVSVYTG